MVGQLYRSRTAAQTPTSKEIVIFRSAQHRAKRNRQYLEEIMPRILTTRILHFRKARLQTTHRDPLS